MVSISYQKISTSFYISDRKNNFKRKIFLLLNRPSFLAPDEVSKCFNQTKARVKEHDAVQTI